MFTTPSPRPHQLDRLVPAVAYCAYCQTEYLFQRHADVRDHYFSCVHPKLQAADVLRRGHRRPSR